MNRDSCAVLWFKRDLRLADHAALDHAMQGASTLLPVFVFEPAIWQADDCSGLHIALLCDALNELDEALRARGSRLYILHGELPDLFEAIWQQFPFGQLHSHQETGNAVSFARDLAVARWCHSRGVAWSEPPQDGVIRRLASRDAWASRWEARMAAAPSLTPERLPPPPLLNLPGALESPKDWQAKRDSAITMRQRGGRAAGLRALHSFLTQRGQYYRGSMSSPLTAERACSRLSPHLAYGTLSMREIVHTLRERQDAIKAMTPDDRPPNFLASLTSFNARLHWHCHFMQKLESEPRIEFENFLPALDGLRENDFDRERFERWQQGLTGYPLVDACMCKLAATGWINFRMRAMLVSFAAFPLWLHWREPGLHLARLFVDYEPGIHWSQMQMQSGTTGINALRIYNPVKQARDQDPQGVFVRRWVPALAQVPDDYLFEPWLMPTSMQARVGCQIGIDYPAPIVDFQQAAREAKQKLGERLRGSAAREQARTVMQRHGSRKSGLAQSTTRRPKRKKSAATQAPDGEQLEMDW